MGVISILLGIISFFCFTGAGAIIANVLVDYKNTLSMAFTNLKDVSNATFVAVIVGFFVFIGLLNGVSLIMHGLTYNKLARLESRMKHKV